MRSIEQRIVGLNMTMQDAKGALAQAETLDEKVRQQGIIDYCLGEIRQLQEERQGKK
jgi:hypothetical protein